MQLLIWRGHPLYKNLRDGILRRVIEHHTTSKISSFFAVIFVAASDSGLRTQICYGLFQASAGISVTRQRCGLWTKSFDTHLLSAKDFYQLGTTQHDIF